MSIPTLFSRIAPFARPALLGAVAIGFAGGAAWSGVHFSTSTKSGVVAATGRALAGLSGAAGVHISAPIPGSAGPTTIGASSTPESPSASVNGGHVYGATIAGEVRGTKPSSKPLALSATEVTMTAGQHSQMLSYTSPDGTDIGRPGNMSSGIPVAAVFDGPANLMAHQQIFYLDSGNLGAAGTYTLHMIADSAAKVRYDGYITVHLKAAPPVIPPDVTFSAYGANIVVDPGLAGPVYSYEVHVKLRLVRSGGYQGLPTMYLSGLTKSADAPECYGTGWPPQKDYSTADEVYVYTCRVVNQIEVPHGTYNFSFTAKDDYFKILRTAATTFTF